MGSAAFAEEDFISRHAHAGFAMLPSQSVFKVLRALGVSAVRFCSEVNHPIWPTPAGFALYGWNSTRIGTDATNAHGW
jgi:hypothetical protein